jgi:hypothetical protein
MPRTKNQSLTTRSSKRNEPFNVSSDPVNDSDLFEVERRIKRIDTASQCLNRLGAPVKPTDNSIQHLLKLLSKSIEEVCLVLELYEPDTKTDSDSEIRRPNEPIDPSLDRYVQLTQRIFAHIDRRKHKSR